jgi:hypothetical protein
MTYTGIHGTPPTTNPNANGQHNSARRGQQQHHEKAKSNGHEIPWLRDRENQGQFRHYWVPGKENNGNYVTKHHALIHHQATQPTFLTGIATLQALRKKLTGILPVARVC